MTKQLKSLTKKFERQKKEIKDSLTRCGEAEKEPAVAFSVMRLAVKCVNLASLKTLLENPLGQNQAKGKRVRITHLSSPTLKPLESQPM